jgi:hypothetical protein
MVWDMGLTRGALAGAEDRDAVFLSISTTYRF